MFMKKILGATALTSALLSFGPAQAVPVDLELLFMNDVSGSIDTTDFNAQISGYAAAFRDSTLIDKIQAGTIGKIAVSIAFYASSISSSAWYVIEDSASGEAFASAVELLTRPSVGSSDNVSGVLPTAVGFFDNNGFEGTRNVIDIVTEGAQDVSGCAFNQPICVPVQDARDAALAGSIDAINAMVLTDRTFFGPGVGFTIDSIPYAQNNYIGGTGSFVVAVDDFSDFAPAIRNKIEREVVGPTPVPVPAAAWLLLAGMGSLAAISRRKTTTRKG